MNLTSLLIGVGTPSNDTETLQSTIKRINQNFSEIANTLTSSVRASISVSGSLSYNSTTGVITFSGAPVALSGSYSDLTNKPSIPTKFSDLINDSGLVTVTDARSAISVSGSLTYDVTTGVITSTGVNSVAGRTGAVTILSADISDASSAASANTLVKRDASGNFSGGTITATLNGNASSSTLAASATKLAIARTISMSGDITWTSSFDGSVNATGTAVLASSGVVAGSYGTSSTLPTITIDAKGRVTAASSTPITFPITSVAGRSGAVTLISSDITDATDRSTGGTIVRRDSTGNFVAATITANLIGTASSASTADTASRLSSARTIAIAGDASASFTFDGTTNVTTTLTLASTAVVAGSYGTSTSVAKITVDAKGRITSATSTPIMFPDISGKQDKTAPILQDTRVTTEAHPWIVTRSSGASQVYPYIRDTDMGVYDQLAGAIWSADFAGTNFSISAKNLLVAGANVWTNANFNPTKYSNLTTSNLYASGTVNTFTTSGKLAGNGGDGIAFEIRSDGSTTGGSFAVFHRPGTYATRFGLNENNEFAFGGWSEGANTQYRIWTEKNFTPASYVLKSSLATPARNRFSAADSNLVDSQISFTVTSGYTPGFVQVYYNGFLLIENKDYTATDGSVVTFNYPVSSSATVEILSQKANGVANAAPVVHTHAISDVAGLQTTLNGVSIIDGANTPTTQLTTASWVRAYGSGAVNVLSCLTATQRADVLSNTGNIDLTSTIQAFLVSTGAGKVIWPAGTYQILGTLLPPSGQDNIGFSSGWNSGTIIYTPAATSIPTFNLTSAQTVKGFSFRSSNTATQGNSTIKVKNTNGVTISECFFFGGYAQIAISGTSFYLHIENCKFCGGAVYAILGTSSVDAGFDFTARNNRFLGATPDRTVSIARLTGLGSGVWTDNIISVSGTSGPSFWIEDVAPLFGGFQSNSSVYEQAGDQPAFYAQGTSRTIPYLHMVNNVITGDTGPAVLLANTFKGRFIGGAISSSSTSGAFQIQSYGVSDDLSLTDVTFEGVSTASPFQCAHDSGGGVTMTGVKWQAAVPIFDGSAMSAGALKYFNFFGGNPGKATQPFKFPANTTNVCLMYAGSVTANQLNMGTSSISQGSDGVLRTTIGSTVVMAEYSDRIETGVPIRGNILSAAPVLGPNQSAEYLADANTLVKTWRQGNETQRYFVMTGTATKP